MKVLKIKLAACFAGALFSLTVHANDSAYLAELNQLAAKSDLNELIKRVNQPQNPEELRAGLNWLKEKSLSGFGGSRIIYSYAYLLFGAGIKDTASFAYMLASLSGHIDAARCADPSAPGVKIQRWQESLTPIAQHFNSLPANERKRVIDLALAWEEKLVKRGPDHWLCSGGLSQMSKLLAHPDNSTIPMPDKSEPGGPRTVVLSSAGVVPEFVSDEAWRAKRQQVIAEFSSKFK